MEANFQLASETFDEWREDVLVAQPPVFYSVGQGDLARIEIGPKLVTLFGGAPGSGKTALVMQCVIDGLRLNPELRAVVCNIEMPPTVLLDRQLSRLAGIDARTIRHRSLDASHSERLELGLATLESVADRLAFVRPPFDLSNVAATADAVGADLLVFDYIQRISPPGHHGDKRGAVDATMSYLRQFADSGAAVIVVAALSRQKDKQGRSSYGNDVLNLASFRESSELEFGADDAFILAPDEKDEGPSRRVILRHLKARHTEPRDLVLQFDRHHQSFTTASSEASSPGKLEAAISELWACTSAAEEEVGT